MGKLILWGALIYTGVAYLAIKFMQGARHGPKIKGDKNASRNRRNKDHTANR